MRISGALYKFINMVGNVLLLNVIFVLTTALSAGFCLGTSMTALYATFLDLKTDNSGYYIRNYFKHFKGNFKRTILFNIAFILLAGAAYLNTLWIFTLPDETLKIIAIAVWALIVFEIAIVTSFMFPVIAKFDGGFIHQLYLAFMFAHKYIYLSVLFVLLFVLAVLLCIYVSVAFLAIIFGAVIYIETIILKKIWRKYEYETLPTL